MSKILLAVDGSEVSVRATQALIEAVNSRKEAPQIDVLTVHRPLPNVGTMATMINKEMRETYYREDCDEALALSLALLDAAQIKYQTHRLVGPIAETIVQKAEELGSDIIYMGTHGRGGTTKLVIGSVANKVLQLAKTPIQFIK